MPANGETVTITTQSDIPVKVSDQLLKRALEEYNGKSCFLLEQALVSHTI